MRVYALRHKVTGDWLPAPLHGRGASFLEPAPNKKPRLFWRPNDAANARQRWALGIHKALRSREIDTFGEYTEVSVVVQAVPYRNADDLEIVSFDLHEIPYRELDPGKSAARKRRDRQKVQNR